ncbi:MAG: hypothetical protein II561_00640 [Thermoguttaceae bacterium]|nr:hypothetical protein [Thermoguttaceae bacterium]MBQ1862962.1 hypothetical protein [Thermoguttaceae bacterium]MBQ2037909.1 hypothetical protein [Thermoguttaceae bacterium]MBQ2555035.1 hypothetical protein [Thermoguttaceae bacterium]MBQ3822007.1 hypothetical protein [Thermoguttaceae bacterium]
MAKNYNEYNDLGVRFLYPANWFVRTETWDKGTYSITVDTPDGGFWSLSIYPKGVNLDTAALQAIDALKTEYDQVEKTEIHKYVADFELSGYEADFFYLDLTSTATALKFEDGRRGYVIFWQTCDSMTTSADDPVRSDVFNAMTHTLVSNLTGQEDDWGDEEDELMFERKLSARQERELEDREYRRSRYEKARQDFEDRLWRRSDDSDDMRLEDFMVADRGARGSKRGKKPRLDEEFEGEFNFGANPHDSDE